jgi:hypothetical protein
MHPYVAMIIPFGEPGIPGVPTHPIVPGSPGVPTHPIGETPPSVWPGGSPSHPIVFPPAGPPPTVPPGMVLIMVYRSDIGWTWAVVTPEAVNLPTPPTPPVAAPV